jgi:hypothetical protein
MKEYKITFIGENFRHSVIVEGWNKQDAEDIAKRDLLNFRGIDLYEIYGMKVIYKILGK